MIETKDSILEYAKIAGYESALAILLLGGYDSFDGSIEEFDAFEKELENLIEKEK